MADAAIEPNVLRLNERENEMGLLRILVALAITGQAERRFKPDWTP